MSYELTQYLSRVPEGREAIIVDVPADPEGLNLKNMVLAPQPAVGGVRVFKAVLTQEDAEKASQPAVAEAAEAINEALDG